MNKFLPGVVLLATLCASAASAAQPATACTFDILLTNDDGWDAPGIGVLHRHLATAGHRVTLVAPLTQQSGRGGALTTRIGAQVAVVEQRPGVWSVDGTPTDAVRGALDVILAGSSPDIVISGANFGPNLGQEAVHSSGTLGAALAAHYEGLPAIAVSTGIVPGEREQEPPYPSTLAGFETAGAVVVGLLQALAAPHDCARVLPDGVALNVNVPVPVDTLRGIRYAPLSLQSLYRLVWSPGDTDGLARIGFERADPSTVTPGDDVDLFSRGYVTITPINGDLTLQALPAATGLPTRLPRLLPPAGD